EIGTSQASQQSWEKIATTEADMVARHERRHQLAVSLGETGECDACGQVFGKNLPQALAHLTEEIRAASERRQGANEEATKARAAAAQATKQLEQLQTERGRLETAIRTFDPLVGEQTVVEADIDELIREIASIAT